MTRGGILLRELVARGELATAELPPAEIKAVRRAAYQVVWPLVFNSHTRPLEKRKGHLACASSVTRLAAECLDGFYDDVEAVVDNLFRRAKKPIRSLEAWITRWMTAAIVDAYRQRRGERGAQQKPRIPRWLATALDRDPWLVKLAEKILEWVGVTATAGLEIWPLNAWAELRGTITGDWGGDRPAVVAGEVKHVLDVMRGTRPHWYARYVEQPMGHKWVPVAAAPWQGDLGSLEPLSLTTREDRDDADLTQLAALAVQSLAVGLACGAEPRDVVRRVLRTLFLGPEAVGHDLDRTPHATTADRDEQLSAALADDLAVDRIVEAVLAILA